MGVGAEGGGGQNQQRQHLTDCEKQLKTLNDAKNVKKSGFFEAKRISFSSLFCFQNIFKLFSEFILFIRLPFHKNVLQRSLMAELKAHLYNAFNECHLTDGQV